MLANFFFFFFSAATLERCSSCLIIITLELVWAGAVTVRVSSEQLGSSLRPRHYIVALLRLWQQLDDMWPSPKCDIMNRNPELVDIDSNFNYVFTMVFYRAWPTNLLYSPTTPVIPATTNRMIFNCGSWLLHHEELFRRYSFFVFTMTTDVALCGIDIKRVKIRLLFYYSEKVFTTFLNAGLFSTF